MDLWYVIQTKLNREKQVQYYLSTHGVQVFNPLIEAFSLRDGRREKDVEPLFPSYVFGKFDLEKDYPLVRWARGVKKVLGFGGYPVPVSEEVIDSIRRRADNDGIVRRAVSFAPNDTVRITSGPLRDLLGIFERWVSAGERVRILLKLIGYQPALELHYSMIEKVA